VHRNGWTRFAAPRFWPDKKILQAVWMGGVSRLRLISSRLAQPVKAKQEEDEEADAKLRRRTIDPRVVGQQY